MGNQTREWWRGGVIYQIYPRSFFDSNADGIGDLPGITQKLSYIANLGVDAIWLSPFFTSPMLDFGYDISDYKNVDPMFGTLDDFKVLLNKAHDLGLRVIIDQVYSHTSDQHDWFKESRVSKNNSKADWYVWADAKADGTAPNNWLSIFGGPAWQWDSRRRQYYQHNFLSSQPDVNFHNEDVQQAILEVARFWLELGVDGFRLDVVNMYFQDKLLRDNPIAKSPEQKFVGASEDNPWSRQYHIYQITQPENLPFLTKLRTLIDQYENRFTVGEIGAPDGMKVMAEYTSGGDKLHSSYTFELLGEDHRADFIKRTLNRIEENLGTGWPCFALSNHDVVRSVTRWGKRQDQDLFAKISLAFLLTLRGSSCIYQGEELGFEEAIVAFEDIRDPFGIEFWPDFKGRDGCRTPMAWTKNGGFTEAPKSWLPLYASHQKKSPETQLNDQNSVYNFVKNFLAWRKENESVLQGDFKWVELHESIVSFTRSFQNKTLLVVFNMTEATFEIELHLKLKKICSVGLTSKINDNRLTLPSMGGLIGYI